MSRPVSNAIVDASEEQSRALAEASREAEWAGRSFVRELFMGNLRVDWVHPYPHSEESEEFKRFYGALAEFLAGVDSARIDREGEYGQHVVAGLRDLGAFGIKIPKGELFPENLTASNPEYIDNGKITEPGIAALREKLPHADVNKFAEDPLVERIPELFTVHALVKYVETKVPTSV